MKNICKNIDNAKWLIALIIRLKKINKNKILTYFINNNAF